MDNAITISLPAETQKDVPIPVTIYWIWPRRYETMLRDIYPENSSEYKDVFAPFLEEQADSSTMTPINDTQYRYTLDSSSNRKAVDDNAKYFRGVQHQAILSMDAMRINQLGINPLELVPDYLEEHNGQTVSRIDLTAALNLENLQNVESILQNTAQISFSLSLLRRNGQTYEQVESSQNYLEFVWQDQLESWSWTIEQEQFYADHSIVVSDRFDGTQFTIPLTAYVFTDRDEFANYKIQMRVSFIPTDGNTVSVLVDESAANVVYTFACIRPSFFAP